jgi:uncharacterized membrane protein YcaP (DUF421 family)
MTVDLRELFLPSLPFLEIFLRGSLVYLGLFALLRLVLKRETGSLEITDLLVVVLIADASQNAMADDYHSITDGLFLVATIIFWSYTLDWLGYHFPAFHKLVHPPPLQLVKDGKVQSRAMRRELITMDELMEVARQNGLDDLTQVKTATMESDGTISIIPVDWPGRPAR